MYFCISVVVTLAYATSNLKSLSHEINYKEKMGARNNHEKKILTLEIPTRKNFGPTNTHEKILDPRLTHEKKIQTQKIPTRKKFWTPEIPTRKNVGPTKYPQRHGGTMARIPQNPQ